MKVNSKVKINTQKIKQLTRAQTIALEQTAEALHTQVVQAQVIPRDTGALQNESTFVDYSEISQGKTTLVSSTPYSRRLYYHPEYDFKTDENPNAKGHWYEDWVDGSQKDFCKNAYKEFYRRAGGL
ncbi:MAG: hypothetical protein K0R92_1518 [Lachnospiraceae bacterium]|jgi:hypothetical protein|nr:hypothetical protein [Lachnospiraceae bacterium]